MIHSPSEFVPLVVTGAVVVLLLLAFAVVAFYRAAAEAKACAGCGRVDTHKPGCVIIDAETGHVWIDHR